MASAPSRGRGALANPVGRFESTRAEPADDGWWSEPGSAALRTEVRDESARSVIARNDSPDLPFDYSINPYRGCEHGCVYCYARPTHEYLGLSAGLDFETRLTAKANAAQVLRRELAQRTYRPSPINLGAATDPYQPLERERRITRSLLEVFLETRHPLTIVTKNALVLRDLDLLRELAAARLVEVNLSVTTLDNRLAARLEPRASAPHARLRAVAELAAAGVPVGVFVAPVIPALTDAELESVMAAAAEAGAQWLSYTLIVLHAGPPAARRRRPVPRVAGRALPGPRRARDEPAAADPRRARQRSALRHAHAWRGGLRGADPAALRAPQAGAGPGRRADVAARHQCLPPAR